MSTLLQVLDHWSLPNYHIHHPDPQAYDGKKNRLHDAALSESKRWKFLHKTSNNSSRIYDLLR